MFRVDVLMLSILDKQQLTAKQLKKKHKVIKMLGEFLRKPNSEGLVVPTWDREMDPRDIDNGFSWLGWTVMNGTADDVAALIRSKQPYDPLLGKILNILQHNYSWYQGTTTKDLYSD